MAAYISHLDVHHHGADEQKLKSQGFMKINVDLNKGSGGKATYLWYKKTSCAARITRIQLTFNIQMSVGLIRAEYTRCLVPIVPADGVDPIYIWYFKGSTEYDTPIVDIDVTEDPESEALKFCQGWEKLACNLKRKVGGDWLYIWVKRVKQNYICDFAATDSFTSDERYFRDGYIRLDEDLRRDAGGTFVFLWYCQTTDFKRGLDDLKVSTTKTEFQALQVKDYQPVGFNFNEWLECIPMYLCYKREGSNSPIKAINLLLNTDAVQVYQEAGVTMMKNNLNYKGCTEYLCFYP